MIRPASNSRTGAKPISALTVLVMGRDDEGRCRCALGTVRVIAGGARLGTEAAPCAHGRFCGFTNEAESRRSPAPQDGPLSPLSLLMNDGTRSGIDRVEVNWGIFRQLRR